MPLIINLNESKFKASLLKNKLLLFNNVPMEVVPELLGHSKMATTQQSYGKIVQRKVGEEMARIREG